MLDDLAGGTIALRSVQTELPSPFASALQFGFVMDWMYADDAPHAEQRAALLSLDRALLDELLGTEGADAETLVVLEEMLARRRGVAPGSRARTADELAILLDRAGDLSLDELRERTTHEAEGRLGDPLGELLERGRIVEVGVPTGSGSAESRYVLAETSARFAAAFGAASPIRDAARREILLRFISLSGVVSVADVLVRYAFDPDWVRERFDEWTRTGRLVRGAFGGNAADRWCSRRLLERARRRELSQARKQIQAVDLERFSRFMFRWQHVTPSGRLDGDDATTRAARQLYGVSRPAELWERELFPARAESYDSSAIARLIAAGEMVWVGGGAPTAHDATPVLANIRMLRRGTGRAWLPESHPPIGEAATATLDAMTRMGAVFFDELLAETSFSSRKLRDALRELVGAGLATNDTIDAMRAVVRWRPLVSPRERSRPDPTRWLPADYSPSANRHVVQRRPNLRRLPRWQRPDLPGAGGDADAWPGRWSLVASPRVLGAPNDESALGEAVARQWLDRYGVVAREIWRRERPMIPWRAIYRELKRLEFRGEVRRGYFVRGLSGAQFALPEAVEALRADEPGNDEAVVIAAADPANVFSLPIPGDPARDPFVLPRNSSALLVAVGGRVVLIAERRGSRVAVRPDTDQAIVASGAEALVRHLSSRLRRDLVLETIDGQPSAASPHATAFEKAGFRRGRTDLRYLRPAR
jgi:ATP-dependent Lhr-like helicase